MKTKILNISILIIGIAAIGLIAAYYVSYWKNNIVEETVEITLPERHSEINKVYFPEENGYCLACHNGIEPARPLDSEMMRQIMQLGEGLGDPNGCVVCHGGTPSETKDKFIAHSRAPKGSLLNSFTPVPGSMHINENTCGQCHEDHTYNVHRSIMNTDAGKMKAITWSFGVDTENKDHKYANHETDDPDGDTPRFGSDIYKEYMQEMAANFPGQYPRKLKQIPQVSINDLNSMSEQAAFSYLRNCNACHLDSKGMQDRGHFRGMGCAACHNIYSNEGYYEGSDKSIDSTSVGHVLIHSMQGSRKSAVQINDSYVSGIQVSTCAACHAAGRRIGHAYQGFMALENTKDRGPFDENGNPQSPNAGYVFKYMHNDVHHRIEQNGKEITGLLCQDCHTTNAMHGNGNIGSTTLATVEIECSDCHGTPTHYPWELPIGYGDEFGKTLDMESSRGVANEPMNVTSEFGNVYAKEDGYILSSRGNALGNVVRRGKKVIVHSEGGNDFEVPVLKQLTEDRNWVNKEQAITSMVSIEKHMQSLECYACHSIWAPQYYGYKYVIDFSKKSIDWLASAEKVYNDGTTADFHKRYVMQDGAATQGDYSHIRWENTPLGINGEGRVTPLVGVIQTVSTVIDKDGDVIVWNHAAKTANGYNAMELAPVNPHTTSREARQCADCHGNLAALGYGIDGGRYDAEPDKEKYADVVDSYGNNISRYSKVQISAIKNLHGDFMQILNERGEQLQTIDSHWPTSMPLTDEQRDALSRGGTCIACHQDIPNGAIPIKMLGKIAEVTHLDFASESAHGNLLRQNNILISWVKAGGLVALVIFIPLIIVIIIRRKSICAFIKKVLKRFVND